ncbi:hypothetical protein PputUW4_03140 [Pseudomonas sp. UW4]|nr:hypothetical protein PputUW4_03140 [Pseudomonas sp. UW4]
MRRWRWRVSTPSGRGPTGGCWWSRGVCGRSAKPGMPARRSWTSTSAMAASWACGQIPACGCWSVSATATPRASTTSPMRWRWPTRRG